MGRVVGINRTLDQELAALFRGASLECLVCGEFVLRLPGGSIFCPECSSAFESSGSAEDSLVVPALQ